MEVSDFESHPSYKANRQVKETLADCLADLIVGTPEL